jgi:recombination protein RecA
MELLKETLKNIENKFGKEVFFSQEKIKKENIIPSGSLMLDDILGIGGFPKGRIIEIYGNESCGKTTIALQTIAQCQQKNEGKIAYIDFEHALDASYCQKLNVDIKRMLVIHPLNEEQGFDIINALIKANAVDMIVIDSVAAMVPKAEMEGDFGDQTIGLHARNMSKGLRIMQTLMNDDSPCIIFINQLREKVGVMYGNPETTTGGKALKFYSSIRIELRRKEILKNGNSIVGIKTNAKIVKNKLAPALRETTIDIFYDKGFDYQNEVFEYALEKGIIEKRGS